MPATAAPTPDALFALGNQHLAAQDYAAAAQCYQQALAYDPVCPEVLANLAYAKEQQQDFSAASQYYHQALQHADPQAHPSQQQIYINAGALLTRCKAFAAAESIYRELLQQVPGSAAGWSNLGVLLAGLRRETEAEYAYRTALSLMPDYRTASFNLSYLLLRQERWQEGWQRLEARTSQDALAKALPFARWQGESLHGKRILIVFECGFGDMLQFCRYARQLKQLGAAQTGLLCHPPLKRLLQTLPDADAVYGYDETLPDELWDVWVPIFSLPHLCGTRRATIPAQVPYLSATPQAAAHWHARLGQQPCRIGIAWQGNPQFETDQDRSLPGLSSLHSLLQQSGVQWVSLQKGPAAQQARDWQATPLFCADQELHDFADTAALISQLDLVISIDSAVLHLAGALGKPAFLLLPYYRQDWRWLASGQESPWYPTVRIFRQRQDGDWAGVIREVQQALQAFLQRRAPQTHTAGHAAT